MSKNCHFTLCVTQLVPFHLSPFFVASDTAGFDKYFQSVLTNTSGLIWQIRGAGHYGGTSVEIAAQLVRSRPIWLLDNPTPAYLIKTDLMKMTFKLSYLIWRGIPWGWLIAISFREIKKKERKKLFLQVTSVCSVLVRWNTNESITTKHKHKCIYQRRKSGQRLMLGVVMVVDQLDN